MTAKSYSFKLGNFDCAVLLDGSDVIVKERFLKRYPDATEANYRQAFAEIDSSLDEADSSFNILLIKTGEEVILVDAGEGGNPTGGYVVESLKQVDISPEDITLIIITHIHGDHVKGLLSDDNQPVFPNARYVVSQVEIPYLEARQQAGIVDYRAIFDMMQGKGLRLIEMDEEIISGITALPIPGHTPGQIALLIESEGKKLLHTADLLHSPIQFAHPEWSAKFDDDTSISVPTRKKALQYAADENLLTLFYHLTFPGLGRVKTGKKGFIWETIDKRSSHMMKFSFKTQ